MLVLTPHFVALWFSWGHQLSITSVTQPQWIAYSGCCCVLVFAPDGSSIEARALLDNDSTSSFVSERLVQSLGLVRSQRNVCVSRIAGSLANSPICSIANFQISFVYSSQEKIDLTAIVLPKGKWFASYPCSVWLLDSPIWVTASWPIIWATLTCWNFLGSWHLHKHSLSWPKNWTCWINHIRLSCLWRKCVIQWCWNFCCLSSCVYTISMWRWHTPQLLRDWGASSNLPVLTPKERSVVQHFDATQYRTEDGRFVVLLPRISRAKTLGESWSQAVRRLLALEVFGEVDAVMQEYLTLSHAKAVPVKDAEKDPSSCVIGCNISNMTLFCM